VKLDDGWIAIRLSRGQVVDALIVVADSGSCRIVSCQFMSLCLVFVSVVCGLGGDRLGYVLVGGFRLVVLGRMVIGCLLLLGNWLTGRCSVCVCFFATHLSVHLSIHVSPHTYIHICIHTDVFVESCMMYILQVASIKLRACAHS
jgi:hypothetical protein